jgi:hypothetical protein
MNFGLAAGGLFLPATVYLLFESNQSTKELRESPHGWMIERQLLPPCYRRGDVTRPELRDADRGLGLEDPRLFLASEH